MQNKFFTLNRLSDLDHYLPVAYSIISSNSNIRVYFIFLRADRSLSKINYDKRLKFIESLNINFYNKNILRFKFIIMNKIEKFIPNRLIILVNKIFDFFMSFNFYRLVNFYKPKTIFVDISFNNNLIKNLKVKYNIKIISLPHGTHLHKGYINDQLHSLVFPKINISPLIDNVVLCNKNDMYLLNITNNTNIFLMGSLRYSYYWTNFLKKKIIKKNISKKIKVIFFEDKQGQFENGKFIPWINNNLLFEILSYLKTKTDLQVTICKHPSKIISDFVKFNFPYTNIQDPSYEVVYNSDIVIGTIGSSMLDGFIFQKKIISLSYCHYFTSLLDIFENDNVVTDFNNFKLKLKSIILELKENKSSKYKKFYNNIICNADNIEKNYANL